MPIILPTAAEAARMPWLARERAGRVASAALREYRARGYLDADDATAAAFDLIGALNGTSSPPRISDAAVTRCGGCGAWALLSTPCTTCAHVNSRRLSTPPSTASVARSTPAVHHAAVHERQTRNRKSARGFRATDRRSA